MNIEEAKKILKDNLEKWKKDCQIMIDKENFEFIQAIETVLQELEKYEKQLDLDYVDKNYISKEIIREILKDIEKQYKIDLEKNSTEAFILKCQIQILEELLEE